MSKFCSKYKNYVLFSLFYFFFETSASFKFFFLPVYWKQIGLSATQIGVLRIVWGVAYTTGSICIGYAADRWRIRKTLLLVTVFASMATPLLGMIPQRRHDVCIVTEINATKNTDVVSKLETRSIVSPPRQRHRLEIQSSEIGDPASQLSGHKTSHHYPELHGREYAVVYSKRSIEKTPKRVVYTLKKNPKDLRIIFWSTLCILAVGEFLSSAVFNLANSAILDDLGENHHAYSRVRLWGPLGQFISTPVTTTLMSHFSYYLCGEYQDGMPVAFTVIALVVIASFGLATAFEVQSYEANETSAEAKEVVSVGAFFFQYQNAVYLFMVLYMGCCDGVVLTFAFWYMKELDVKTASTVFGFARMLCSVVSAALLWFVGPAIKSVGYPAVVSLSLLLFSGWFVGVSLMTSPWMMLLYESVGYTAYVASFSTFVTFFGEVTPSYLMDRVQGLINCLFLGAGCGVGGLLTGVMIDIYGPSNSFRYWAFCTVALLVVFVLSQMTRYYFNLKENDAGYTPVVAESQHDITEK